MQYLQYVRLTLRDLSNVSNIVSYPAASVPTSFQFHLSAFQQEGMNLAQQELQGNVENNVNHRNKINCKYGKTHYYILWNHSTRQLTLRHDVNSTEIMDTLGFHFATFKLGSNLNPNNGVAQSICVGIVLCTYKICITLYSTTIVQHT